MTYSGVTLDGSEMSFNSHASIHCPANGQCLEMRVKAASIPFYATQKQPARLCKPYMLYQSHKEAVCCAASAATVSAGLCKGGAPIDTAQKCSSPQLGHSRCPLHGFGCLQAPARHISTLIRQRSSASAVQQPLIQKCLTNGAKLAR